MFSRHFIVPLPLLLFTSILFADKPIAVQRAFAIQTQVEQGNRIDLEWLWDSFRRKTASLSTQEREELVETLLKKIEKDKSSFTAISQILADPKTEDRGSTELRTSLAKLIGEQGILANAITLANSDEKTFLFKQSFKTTQPTHNQITVLKTLLVYANLAAAQQENLTQTMVAGKHRLQLFYPTSVPSKLEPAAVSQLGLYCQLPSQAQQFYIPNAGFVFGGDFIHGTCRGVDCSAFLSYCTNSRERLSTMVMEYTWRELHDGVGSFSEMELEIRKDFLAHWGMQAALEEYEALELGKDTPHPGDIILWRWNTEKGRSGHVVLYLEAGSSEGNFLGIEATRADDKTKEGIVSGMQSFRRPNADTYILRRKPF